MMHRAFGFALSALAMNQALGDHAPRRYQVDLDLEPAHRWDEVAAAEKDVFKAGLEGVYSDDKLAKLAPILKNLVGNKQESRRILPEDIFEELEGISRVAEVDFEDISILALFYDLFAAAKSPIAEKACSGIIAQTASGEILHGRNLDFTFTPFLESMTIVVDFVRKNETKFTAVTFGPSPIFNTAVRYGAFSITQNERDRGDMATNLFDVAVLARPAIFASMRQVMESEEVNSFEKAVDYWSTLKISAAAYIIVAGVNPGEGVVLTRDRDQLVDVWRLNATAGQWYLVETNYDHFDAAPFGDDRRGPEERALDAIGQGKINAEGILEVLSIKRVNRTAGEESPNNDETVYTTIMQATKPSTFRTIVRDNSQDLPSGQHLLLL